MGLNRSGALAAAVLGTVCVIAGREWIMLLLAFFVSGTALSKIGERRKLLATGGISAKHGPRDAWQVLANGGVFAAAALGSMIAPSAAWMIAGAGAIAASAADTWASEIGTLSPEKTRSIVTGQVVPVGTSGGITLAGTAAAIAGAAFIAVLAIALGWSRAAAHAAVIGGFAGSLIDSIVGATLQARRWCGQCGMETERTIHICGTATKLSGGLAWLDNDAVNVIGSLSGAATGAMWAMWAM